MKRAKQKIYILVIIATTTLITSCEKNETEESITKEQTLNPYDPVVKMLLNDGWSLSQIQPINSDFYLVGNDYRYSSDIKNYYDFSDKNISKQAKSQHLVDSKHIQKVSVYVEKGLLKIDKDWDNITDKAIAEWNGIQNSKLNLIRVLNAKDANIIIDWDNELELDDNTFAAADLPKNGKPGNKIIINTDYINPNNTHANTRQKLFNLVHEFGHTIGFEHTNYKDLKEPGLAIPGTPERDPGSVMNGGMANRPWFGFSKHDKLALQILYPE